jgi:hypothetical protein
MTSKEFDALKLGDAVLVTTKYLSNKIGIIEEIYREWYEVVVAIDGNRHCLHVDSFGRVPEKLVCMV